jgi:hypothetical protein
MPSRKPAAVTISEIQTRVLSLFREYGAMDDYSLIDRYRWNYDHSVAESTPRTRRRELADKGLLSKRKETNLAASGRELSVWGLA